MQSQEMILSTRAGARIRLSPHWPGNETGPCFSRSGPPFPAGYSSRSRPSEPDSHRVDTSVSCDSSESLWSPPRAVGGSLAPRRHRGVAESLGRMAREIAREAGRRAPCTVA